MGNFLIMTREDSLVAIRDWDFMPNDDGKVRPIALTLPQMTVEELSNMVNRYATICGIDGDVRPGTRSLLVFSEALARELIEFHGCYFVKTKVFFNASAL